MARTPATATATPATAPEPTVVTVPTTVAPTAAAPTGSPDAPRTSRVPQELQDFMSAIHGNKIPGVRDADLYTVMSSVYRDYWYKLGQLANKIAQQLAIENGGTSAQVKEEMLEAIRQATGCPNFTLPIWDSSLQPNPGYQNPSDCLNFAPIAVKEAHAWVWANYGKDGTAVPGTIDRANARIKAEREAREGAPRY